MGSSAPATASDSIQYLNSLLSQRGATALPYREDVKHLLRHHLLDVTQSYPSLKVRSNPFVHNDGTSVNLLQLDGTVPMTYQGFTYNIPVCIWLLEGYPRSAPRVFVAPTKDMVLKRPHKHVDASGLVSLPYLQNWVHPRSDLLELTKVLSVMFGNDPPLYSKPRNTSTRAATFQAPSPYPRQASPQRTRIENPSEVFRRNAISILVKHLTEDIKRVRRSCEAEMDEMVTIQGHLQEREKELQLGIQGIMLEKDCLEQQLQVILTNTDILDSWLKVQGKPCMDTDVDTAFEPCDAHSKQMLECTSADLAIEDALYSLDKAVQEGSIPVDAYLKQVRILSREQFFHRAMYEKVRAA